MSQKTVCRSFRKTPVTFCFRVALVIAITLTAPIYGNAADAPPSPMEEKAARLDELLKTRGGPENRLAKCRSVLPLAEQLIAAEPDEPRWRRNWLDAHGCIGYRLLNLGERDAAFRHFRTVVDFNARLFESGDADLADELFTSQTNLANSLADSDELKFALEAFQTAIDFQIRRATANSDDLSAAYARRALISMYTKIGKFQEKAGAHDTALASYRKGIDLVEQLGPGTSDPDELAMLSIGRAESHDRIARLLRARGDLEGALESREWELDNYVFAWRADPGDVGLANRALLTVRRIAGLWQDMGDPKYALEILQKYLEIVEPVAKETPFYDFQNQLADLHTDMGRIHRAQDNLENALESFQAALEIRQRLKNIDPRDSDWPRKTALAYADFGEIQDALSDRDGAAASYRSAVKIQEGLLRKQPGDDVWRQDLKKWKAFVAKH